MQRDMQLINGLIISNLFYTLYIDMFFTLIEPGKKNRFIQQGAGRRNIRYYNGNYRKRIPVEKKSFKSKYDKQEWCYTNQE